VRERESGTFSDRAAACLLAAAIACAAGCAKPVHPRYAGPIVGAQGSAWEAVLPGPAAAGLGPGPEYARRDADLNIRTSRDRLDAGAWPDDRPSLSRRRILLLPTTHRGLIYFEPEPPPRSWWP
jgi:hypothetical protein